LPNNKVCSSIDKSLSIDGIPIRIACLCTV
jgi:hypothetical protein